MAASTCHSLCVTDEGQVYAWGNGRGGRLGNASDSIHMEPILIEALSKVKISKVSAAENHSLGKEKTLYIYSHTYIHVCLYITALSSCGDVYSWGLTSASAALGHGDVGAISYPKRIESLKRAVVVGIVAAAMHSVAVTDNGMCYTWG
jgi:alpha-tubulin suppressor-like RCC1 family protein